MNAKSKWNEFLKKGDIKSFLEFRKEQKKDTETACDRMNYGTKRRDSNKKH